MANDSWSGSHFFWTLNFLNRMKGNDISGCQEVVRILVPRAAWHMGSTH